MTPDEIADLQDAADLRADNDASDAPAREPRSKVYRCGDRTCGGADCADCSPMTAHPPTHFQPTKKYPSKKI